MLTRIYVDFNTMMVDERERVLIHPTVYEDLAGRLRPMLPVVLYDEEMEVDAVVEFDEEHELWLGKPDWSTRLPAATYKGTVWWS